MSVFMREGYFFTLTFASALVAASGVPLVAPEYFRLPPAVPFVPLMIGLCCAAGLLLRWRQIRALTLTFLVLCSVASIAAGAMAAQNAIAWLVLGILYGILSMTLLLSTRIRAYLRAR